MPKAVQTMPKLVQVMPKMVQVMPLINQNSYFFPQNGEKLWQYSFEFQIFFRMTLTECGMLDRRADRPVRTMAACEIIFDTARTFVRITTKNFRRESTRQYIASAASEATNTV